VAECKTLDTDLTLDEALAVLEPYFDAARERFLAAGLDRVEGTRLYCARWVHDTPRHFAGCRGDGRAIIVAPEMAELTQEIVLAIMAHELGHAVDFLYPGEFWLADEDVRRAAREATDDVQWVRMQKAWEGRDDDVVERTADAIASSVVGSRIGYVGPCSLQAFDRGRARPQGLR
jgi:hypothetical protein